MNAVRPGPWYLIGSGVDAGSSGAQFANMDPTSPPPNVVVTQMDSGEDFPVPTTCHLNDDLIGYFPYFPSGTEAVLMLHSMLPKEEKDVRMLVVDPGRIVSGVELLEKTTYTRVSNAFNHWMGLPEEEWIDFEKWQLSIVVWLACMRIWADADPEDDVVISNVPLVRSLIDALFVSDIEQFEALRTMEDGALTDWGEYVFDVFQYQFQRSLDRVSAISKVLYKILPCFDEERDYFAKKLLYIFEENSVQFPMTASGELDMPRAIRRILHEDLQFLRRFIEGSVTDGLILHICKAIDQDDIPALHNDPSVAIFGYTIYIYALFGCECGFCPYGADVLAAIGPFMLADNIIEFVLAWRTNPVPFKNGIVHVLFTCGIKFICSNFFYTRKYKEFWERRIANGSKRTISAEIELLRFLLDILEDNSIIVKCDGAIAVIESCFLLARSIAPPEERELTIYNLLNVAFRFSVRNSISDTRDADMSAFRGFSFCSAVCLKQKLTVKMRFVEVIKSYVSLANSDRVVAELLTLLEKPIPFEVQDAIPLCLEYIRENDWRQASQAVESEEIRYDILDFGDNLHEGLNVLSGSQPSQAIACQAVDAVKKLVAPKATVSSPPVEVQWVASRLSPLQIKSHWTPLANLVQRHTLIDVDGDGNCLYRSLSVILLGEQIYYMEMRLNIRHAALMLARGGPAEFPTYFVAAIISPISEPYERWLLDAVGWATETEFATAPIEIQRVRTAMAGKSKQAISVLVKEHVALWFGAGDDPCFHIKPLLWVYAIAVVGCNGRWGELPDLAIIAHCLGITTVVHTLGDAHIRFGDGANAIIHLASNAGKSGGGTHWNPYCPDATEEQEALNELFRAKLMPDSINGAIPRPT
ncbi:MAG: hypothetical protein LBI34_00665 [Puniceicoccales bacterium]|nr:hypothetical protein [Puniceicoccales bacterium]